MCTDCVESIERVFPGMPEKEAHGILIGMTAWPFAHGAYVERQLLTARKALTQGRWVCIMCGRARAKKHMKNDFCKKPCVAKWERTCESNQ